MSIVPTDLDLTAIVAHAAEVTWDSATNGAHGTWDSVPRKDQAKLKEAILSTVLATVAVTREQLADKIEAVDPVEWALAGQDAGTEAAKIVRGQ